MTTTTRKGKMFVVRSCVVGCGKKREEKFRVDKGEKSMNFRSFWCVKNRGKFNIPVEFSNKNISNCFMEISEKSFTSSGFYRKIDKFSTFTTINSCSLREEHENFTSLRVANIFGSFFSSIPSSGWENKKFFFPFNDWGYRWGWTDTILCSIIILWIKKQAKGKTAMFLHYLLLLLFLRKISCQRGKRFPSRSVDFAERQNNDLLCSCSGSSCPFFQRGLILLVRI